MISLTLHVTHDRYLSLPVLMRRIVNAGKDYDYEALRLKTVLKEIDTQASDSKQALERAKETRLTNEKLPGRNSQGLLLVSMIWLRYQNRLQPVRMPTSITSCLRGCWRGLKEWLQRHTLPELISYLTEGSAASPIAPYKYT